MKASIVDLRYKMKDVLKALSRRERVDILYHGKVKGTIIPPENDTEKKVQDFPFFGMYKTHKKPVSQEMEELRGTRYNDI